MFAILNKIIALRSWQLVPYAFYSKYKETPEGLKKEEFEMLLLADANHDIPDNDISRGLLEKELMITCKKGQYKLSDWQKHKSFDNRIMPRMNLQITGRCNFNCKHCFNAKDNQRLQSHFTYEEIINLLDQARDCGIHFVTITGGEPLVHKDIKKIIKAIVDHDMRIYEFNTNGYLLNQDFLNLLKELDQRPCMKISFDGLGYHDKMRGFKGAEKDAIRSIKLCLDNKFEVMAQVNVNKNNINCIYDTVEYLDKLGVNIIRLIRTTEVPRWLENGGKCLSIKEYYDSMIELSKKYISKPRKSKIIIWQLLRIYPISKLFDVEPIHQFKINQCICKGARGMIAIGANGNVYPCMQMSGGYDFSNIQLGNVKTGKLHDILQTETKYMKTICTSIEERAKKNKKCIKCKYFLYCGCGCPALSASKSLIKNTEFTLMNPDEWKCYFFNNRYDLKIIKTFEQNGYRNSSLSIKDDKIK